MEISDQDWQRVAEAYEHGRRQEQCERDFAARNRRIAKELRRVKALLEKCDPETIFEIEAGLPDGQGALLEAVNDGITSTTVNTRDGRPKPWRYIQAVEVMGGLWPPYGGKASVAPCAPCKGRRYHVSGGATEVNPYVRWLGAHLRKLDPSTLRIDSAAWLAAHNALAALEPKTPRKRTAGK